MSRKQPFTEKDYFRRRRARRAGRQYDRLSAWLKTAAARKFERELKTIRY